MAKRRKKLIKIKVLKAKVKKMVAQMTENQLSKQFLTRMEAQETMVVKGLSIINNSIIEILTPPRE